MGGEVMVQDNHYPMEDKDNDADDDIMEEEAFAV